MEKDVDKGGMIGYNSQADSEKLWRSKLKSLGFERNDRSKVENLKKT